MTGTTEDMQQAAEQAHRSRAVHAVARAGLAGRSLVWLVLGLLAASVAFGNHAEADRQGALRAIASRPLGEALLWAVVVGFLGYALWRALAAAVGHRDEDSRGKRTLLRVFSASQVLMYLALAGSAASFVLGRSSSGQDQASSRAAAVLMVPGGRWLLGGLGVAVVVTGLVMGVLAVRREHDDRLDHERIPDRLRTPAVALGVVGRLGRGVVLALLGAFLLHAAVQLDPQDARGFDATLTAIAQQPHGPWLLLVAAASLVAYGLWSFVETAYREV